MMLLELWKKETLLSPGSGADESPVFAVSQSGMSFVGSFSSGWDELQWERALARWVCVC